MKKDAFEIIRKELEQYDLDSVSLASGMSKATLSNWVNKKHKARFASLLNVAGVIGFKIETKAVRG